MKLRPEQQVKMWAERPDVFAAEPAHIRARYGAQVEAERKRLADAKKKLDAAKAEAKAEEPEAAPASKPKTTSKPKAKTAAKK